MGGRVRHSGSAAHASQEQSRDKKALESGGEVLIRLRVAWVGEERFERMRRGSMEELYGDC